MTEFVSGVFLLDKPRGVTSFQVVARMRKILGMKKVGHAGTLDPFATGLLVVCAGRPATKMIGTFMEGEKEYFATLQLGMETETGDPEGAIVRNTGIREPIDADALEAVLDSFRGEQFQTPPAYSALKYKGKPLYHYARQGIHIEKEARRIVISELEIVDGNLPIAAGASGDLKLRVVCSKGTYIRTLGEDIGKKLGCGAFLRELRRTRSGCFDVRDCLDWEKLEGVDAKAYCHSNAIAVTEVGKLLQ